MWPTMNYKEKKIEITLVEEYLSDDINENTIIKEIAMIYDYPDRISYDPDDIALVAYYDCEFGIHTILFSRVQDVKYEVANNKKPWTATFTSNREHTVSDDGNYVDEDILTGMFRNALSAIEMKPDISTLPSILNDLL